jgi:2-polyprenyl-3-methyl-5-hydroxy-6-metoxy-1,4-benzoquinol methylase
MIGEEIRARVFRDTKSFYATFPPDVVSPHLMRFARRHAGKKILDLGCATGNYCTALARLGFDVTGADVNKEYVEIARSRGVNAVPIADRVPFPDGSFDSVLVFEVLEHLPDPEIVVREARRLARKNVLFTTPNSGGIEGLQRSNLLMEHFADLDHKNFYTRDSLAGLLKPHFRSVSVIEDEGINPLGLFGFRPIRLAGTVLVRSHLWRPRFYFRLYALAEV